MARTSAQYAAEYAARQARAKAAGFKGYQEQRKYRQEASKLVPGKSKKAVAARDEVAREMKMYQPGSSDRQAIRDKYSQILDTYDIEIEDVTEADYYAWLDEMSPKKGK